MSQPVRRRLSRREQVASVAEVSASSPSFPIFPPSTGPPDLSDDLLFGAAAIASYLFGDEGERRRVYSLVESGQLPVFHLGSTLCARKSTILNAITAREAAALANNNPQ